MHVHHSRGRAVFGGGDLRPIFLILSVLLVFIFLNSRIVKDYSKSDIIGDPIFPSLQF